MVQDYDHQGSQITELQGQLAAQTQRVEALEAELQGLRQLLGQDAEESEDKEKKEIEASCVWRPGMDIRSERTVQRKGVVGFLSCGEVFNVIQEWRGREGTLFLKLAGDKGWVFDKTRTGTFCVPVGSEWQDWDYQHGSWNNAPGGNGRDRGGDKWSRPCSFWKGQEDKWAWDEKDNVGWRQEQQHAGSSKAPVCAIGLAAGAAYATTREDSAGEAARSMGSFGLEAAAHVRHVAHEHRLSERLDGALSGAPGRAQRDAVKGFRVQGVVRS
ncbi:unnamed protein product [Symbiodinium microadriaticum]|nr:unnamed protein product [Symbiodinium microadriaticum]